MRLLAGLVNNGRDKPHRNLWSLIYQSLLVCILAAACDITISTDSTSSTEFPTTTSQSEISLEQVSYLDCDFSDHAPRVLESVWQVKASSSIGTAFHVGDGRWLTAEHVVSNQSHVTLTHQGRAVVATVEEVDTNLDVALLGSSSAPRTLLFGSLAHLGPGNHAYAVGYPFYEASEAAVSRGIISRVFGSDGGSLVQTDASVNPGNSGGPLVNECGEVIGMVIARADKDNAEGINYSVGEPTLRQWAGISADSLPDVTPFGPSPSTAPTTTRRPAPTMTTSPTPRPTTPEPRVNSSPEWQGFVYVEAGQRFVGIQLASTNGTSAFTILVECSTGLSFLAVAYPLRASAVPPADGSQVTIDFKNVRGTDLVRVSGYTTYLPDSSEITVTMALDDVVDAGVEWTQDALVRIIVPISGHTYAAEFDFVAADPPERDQLKCPSASPVMQSPTPTTPPTHDPGRCVIWRAELRALDELDQMEARYMAEFDRRQTEHEPESKAWSLIGSSRRHMAANIEARRSEMYDRQTINEMLNAYSC